MDFQLSRAQPAGHLRPYIASRKHCQARKTEAFKTKAFVPRTVDNAIMACRVLAILTKAVGVCRANVVRHRTNNLKPECYFASRRICHFSYFVVLGVHGVRIAQ